MGIVSLVQTLLQKVYIQEIFLRLLEDIRNLIMGRRT